MKQLRSSETFLITSVEELDRLKGASVVREAIDENRLQLEVLPFPERLKSREDRLAAIDAMWVPGGASHYQ